MAVEETGSGTFRCTEHDYVAMGALTKQGGDSELPHGDGFHPDCDDCAEVRRRALAWTKEHGV